MLQYYPFKRASGGELADAEHCFTESWYVAQEKYDGIRICVQHDLDGGVRAYTRSAGKHTGVPGDKTSHLAHICDEVRLLIPKGTALDGEIIVPRGKTSLSSEVMRAVGGKGESALAFQETNWRPEFAVFDIFCCNGIDARDKSLEFRFNMLLDLFLHADFRYSFVSPIRKTEDQKRTMLKKIWERGGEGIIFKDIRSVYNEKRDDAWIKVKQRKEYDVVVMGFEEAKATSTKKSGATGDTKYKGMVGAIKFGQFMPTTPEAPLGLKEPFTIPFPTERGMQHAWALRETGKFSGFDDATRKDITENPKKYLHRVVTISAQERLESGHFRHPRFERWREDKAPEECIFRKDEA